MRDRVYKQADVETYVTKIQISAANGACRHAKTSILVTVQVALTRIGINIKRKGSFVREFERPCVK